MLRAVQAVISITEMIACKRVSLATFIGFPNLGVMTLGAQHFVGIFHMSRDTLAVILLMLALLSVLAAVLGFTFGAFAHFF
jgi:hypothetical protein